MRFCRAVRPQPGSDSIMSAGHKSRWHHIAEPLTLATCPAVSWAPVVPIHSLLFSDASHKELLSACLNPDGFLLGVPKWLCKSTVGTYRVLSTPVMVACMPL